MASDETSALPTRIGDYEVLDRLAVGGMAEVYLGRSTREAGFEKLVAIKRVKPHLALVPSFVEMFLDEARIAAKLSHSNIVQIFDLGEADGTYFIAMEYVPGVSLNEIHRHFGRGGCRASGPLAALVVINVCTALEHAHTKRDQEGRPLKIIHRDVSPSNIVVSFEGDIKLIDFGIVKANVQLHQTQGGEIKGKRGYISPEQLLGEQADARSDIFATGMVLHGLLSQRGPRVDEHDGWPPPPPSKFVEGVPPELEAVCMKAIEVDPSRRYQSALAMGTALEAYWQQAPFTRQQLAAWMKESFRPAHEQQRRTAGLPLEPWKSALTGAPAVVALQRLGADPGSPALEATAPAPGATEPVSPDEPLTATLARTLQRAVELPEETVLIGGATSPRRSRLPLPAIGLAALLLALPLGVLVFTWIGTPPPLSLDGGRPTAYATDPLPRVDTGSRDAERPNPGPTDAAVPFDQPRAADAVDRRGAVRRVPTDRKHVGRSRPATGGKRDVPKKSPRLPFQSL